MVNWWFFFVGVFVCVLVNNVFMVDFIVCLNKFVVFKEEFFCFICEVFIGFSSFGLLVNVFCVNDDEFVFYDFLGW